MVAAARKAGCDAVHPGYGFLSENADFADACAEARITFVGPTPEQLRLFGDKARARAHAEKCKVPVLPGTDGVIDLAGAVAFFRKHAKSGIALKAIAGGGGRGMRLIRSEGEITDAFARATAEAKSAFGNGDLYVERLVGRARHIEVQIVGDGKGGIVALGERDCTLQRRSQKIVELAPSPNLKPALRKKIIDAAVTMAKAVKYRSLGTFEFLLEEPDFFFIEANPRLQVEHTVTEEVWGVDLVKAQLLLAGGTTLAKAGLEGAAPRGHAIQLRVNMETMTADGSAKPGGGTLTVFEPPSGPGVRVDTYGYAGYRTNPNFDSLLAKVIVHSPSADFADALSRAERALAAFRLEGAPSNIAFLRALLAHGDFRADKVHTRFVDEQAKKLIDTAAKLQSGLYFQSAAAPASGGARQAGARVDAVDPLAVLAFGKTTTQAASEAADDAPEGTVAVPAPMQGTIVSIAVQEGDAVAAGQPLLIMDAMKMQHEIRSPARGYVRRIAVEAGETIYEGHALLFVEEADVEVKGAAAEETIDLDHVRPDLAEYFDRRALTLDDKRPDAQARRRKTNQRTARQNLDDLVDPGSFVEWGAFAIASQRTRRTQEDLIEKTPADGLITGIGRVNGSLFGPEKSRVAVAHYDYTVLAGTQGKTNHHKKDRLFEIVEEQRIPLVFFTEGGGGRPGDVDVQSVAGLNTMAFHIFGRLSGSSPLVGINSGRCFAGNAALLGCCDVVIATRNSSIGMGGPAMIEGGNLGVFSPEEVGPMSVQVPNGMVDIAVEDEAEAVAVAKKYLSYFQGVLPDWRAADQRLLRRAIPENRLRIYDVRSVIDTLCDEGSVLEIRRAFGAGMVTALGPHRGQAVRHRRQQSRASRRRHRLRRFGQGGAVPAAVRRLRPAGAVPVRHAGHDGGARGREDGAGAPLLAPVRDRRQLERAVRHHRAAQGLRAGRPGDGRRLVPCRHLRHLLADRRVRRHGAGGRGQAGLPQGARSDRRSGRAARRLRQDGGGSLCPRQGAQHRDLFRGRRGDRSRRFPALDRDRPARRQAPPAQPTQETAEHRYVVMRRMPPCAKRGEVARRAGGVMSTSADAYDPSARCAGTSPAGLGREAGYCAIQNVSGW